MSYQVLARKWRPQNFVQMIGQNHVLRALVNAINSQQLHHAYLFTGTRGVGKTTIARILAKCLNCETGITSTPCETCSACVDIRDGKFVDLIEVDAASRTKVEQTRELLENVAYAPTRGRFKIYLIDEVHMLSTHSFNALLKTLEEPPAHVIFLLATTDPERLPLTVLSRCLHFHLKNMSAETISMHLAHILSLEKITSEKEALDLLGQAAKGSMRDALSLLDQAIAYGAGRVETEQVRELLGCIDPQMIQQILQALADNQAQALLSLLESALVQGADAMTILDELITVLHQVAVCQQVPEAAHQAHVKAFAQRFSPQDIQLFYQIAVNGRRDLPWSATMRLGLEMVLLRMLAFYPVDETQPPVMASGAKQPQFDVKLSTEPALPPLTQARNDENPVVKQPSVESKPIQEALMVSLSGKTWSQIAPQLGLTGLAMALASHCVLKSYFEQHIQLALAPQHAPLLNASSAKRIQDALIHYLGQAVQVKIDLEETAEDTLAMQQARSQQQAQQTAVNDIQASPQVQAMMQKLGASIINDSITSREA